MAPCATDYRPRCVQLFMYLQVLDLLTTLVGFKMGASEVSPFIRILMQYGPTVGVVMSKLLAMTLLAVCIWLNKHKVVRWATYWYACVVVWNLSILLAMKPV